MIGKYARSLTGAHRREYKLWLNMYDRCYRGSVHVRQPSYIGCEVSEEFKDFDTFADWCRSQIGYTLPDAQLDKDILHKGNKLYAPSTCVFVPREINQALVRRDRERGALPVGVSLSGNGKFRAQCNRGPLPRLVGTYATPELAFDAYKLAKEQYLKSLAEKYGDCIDARVVSALQSYQVQIND